MGVSPGILAHPNMPDNPEIWKAAAMADHFEKIQKLPEPVAGCPNFRRIPGYKVYCCGQPTADGFKNTLEKVCGTIYPKDGKIVWLNMRQEPNVYVNGNPICARPPNKIGEYAELGAVTTAALGADEPEFMRVVEGRCKENDGKLKYVDISKKEQVVEGLKEAFPGLVHLRVPVCNSAASMTRSASPGPPLPVSSPASSRSSRSTPPSRASWRPFLVSTWTCSRWTGTPWTPPRTRSSGESLRLSKSWWLL